MSIVPTRVRRPLTDHQRFHVRFQDYVRQLGLERTRCDSLLQRLEQSSDRRRQRDLVRKLLGDRRLHRVFAFDAIRRTTGLSEATPDTIAALAEQFDAFRPVEHEPFQMRSVQKGGSVRLVHNFGPRRRMHQMMVDRILRAIHPPPDRQTLFRGGMPKARAAIEAAVADGNTFGVEVDFVGFYASVRPDALSELLRPLPTSVVNAVVWDNPSRCLREGNHGLPPDPTSSSLEGLSLGSACSPIVGETIIASLLSAAQLTDVVTFADNLFVFGRSEEDMVAKIQTLRDTVGNQPFGELELRVAKERAFTLEWSFEFAKQAGTLRQGGIAWSPGHQKLAQYAICEAPRLNFDQIAKLEAKVIQWRRAYDDWHDGDAHAAAYLAALAVRRWYLNRHPVNLQRAKDAVIVAHRERLAIEPGFPGDLMYFIPEEGDLLGDGRARLINALSRHLDPLENAA